MDQEAELAGLRARVRLLEQRIQGLRASRRILMNLLAAQEREKRVRIHRLESENQRLQRRSTRLARIALESNIRLVRLAESQGPGSAGAGSGLPYEGPRNTGTDR